MPHFIAWLKAHVAIDKLFQIGKGGYEFKEARHKAKKAEVEARIVSKQEDLSNLELAMYKLDRRVKEKHGFSASIQDENVYVRELKADPDLVTQVMMKRNTMRTRTPERWESRW